MPVIALDLGGTKLASALFNERGRILHGISAPLANRNGREVGALIAAHIKELLDHARSARLAVNSIGVAVPGISYPKTGRIWAPNIPGWENFPLREQIRRALGRDRIAVEIESDRACCILGETWRGAARGCKDAVFLAVGTGIGAGILVDGKVLRGSSDIAGAIGWMALHRPFRSEYGGCGCFEYYASGEGLAKVARELISQQKRYRGVLKRGTVLTARDVFDAHDAGDPIARQVIRQAVQFWGMAVANLVSLFNPDKIIFGGGVFGPAARFLPEIAAEAKKWAQPISMKQVEIVPSVLGSHAVLYGAAYLALSRKAAK